MLAWRRSAPDLCTARRFGLSLVGFFGGFVWSLTFCDHLISGTLAASLPSSQSPNSSNGFARNAEPESPFSVVAGKCQLSNNQLEKYLQAEVRYLKRRRLIPRRTGDEQESTANSSTNTAAYRCGGSSPVSSVVSQLLDFIFNWFLILVG